MKVKINGKDTEIAENSTIKTVLEQLELKSNMLVVEKNCNIIDKKGYDATTVEEGDELEIVGFFGGG